MSLAVEQTERGRVITNCLRVLAHTSAVDPAFLAECVKAAGADSCPGFGSMHEQHPEEFAGLLSHIGHCNSILEIGSRYGKSLELFAAASQPKSKVVCVDLPYLEGSYGNLPHPEPVLRQTVADIGANGHETHLFLGDSHSPELVAAVVAKGPYDFCFIDGDHSYAGVKADWENFGPHAKIVAFHDIINNADCARLWKEIKAKYRTVEYTDSVWLGIGVVLKDN